MPRAETYVNRVLTNVEAFGRDFFTCEHIREMHAYAWGAIAKAAFQNELTVAIELPQKLERPLEGEHQRQLQSKPDLTLCDPKSNDVCGLVEYESVDINGSRLAYKRYLASNWPPLIPSLEFVMIAMTVPDRPVWPDSPSRHELEEHRVLLMQQTESLSVPYYFLLIDSQQGIDLTTLSNGVVVNEHSVPWRDDAP